ncbi:MAG: hypothetical protein PHQ66_00720 [Candidatus Nanoarchaeia archaeon]|nr:hypothetical protein [Candidatus Nanoarchaeia archaeon]MDD5358499.1 hypothetical protein [Candidatus Nanoarchaeia archaeon]MDD5589013.1 hypothetical protein [Candidatus Nanoarchaeia archaeon]
MKLYKNKRADKILSVYWFAILIIVAGGIFAMVYTFYGSPYDIREIEAELLTNRIADCISYAGKMNSELVVNGQFTSENNYLEKCHLILNSTEWEEEQFYSEVNFYKIQNMNTPVFNVKKGNAKWLSSCVLQENKEEKKLAQCVERSFYSVDNSNNQYIIKILSVVRKSEKNVKI